LENLETYHIDDKYIKQEFEEVFRLYFIPLSHFAQKFVVDLDTAKDIVHEVFIKIWEKREEIDWNKSIKSYLFTAVHNRSLNYLRDSKKQAFTDFDAELLKEEKVFKEENFLEAEELSVQINKALAKLPEKCREVFMLNRFEDLKYAQVAEKLNISIKTVEAQMSKALRILKEELIQYLKFVIIWLLSHINL